MRKKIIFYCYFATIVALIIGCGETQKENVFVVSVDPQRALLEEIVGDRYEVVSVLTPGSNPETFEPGMQTRRQLENATAYFTTGYLPFEHKLAESLPESVEIINSSSGIKPVYGTHEHHHDNNHEESDNHEEGADPHVWTSVQNARLIAKNMYDEVVKKDPEGKDYYFARYSALDQRLDSLDQAFSKQLRNIPTKAFAIWHPSLSYLARDYGLEQIAVGFENKEMPAGILREVIEEAKEDGVRVFFFQKEFDGRQAEILNKELGTTLITINPLDYDWEKQLDGIVSALCR